MSWTDLFYPENPGKRRELVRLFSKLYTLMDSNFRSTNELIDVIQKYLPGKHFHKIYLIRDADIKTNVDIIVERIREIQDYVEVKGQKLRELLEPTLYEELVSTNTKFTTKLKLAKKASTTAVAAVGSVAGVFLLGGIYQKHILKTVVSKLGLIRTAAVSALVLGVFTLGADMIISAIIGAIERDKLNHAIEELNETLDKFEPESHQFDRHIQRVAIFLEEFAKK